ncbi:hypothetical protein F2Q69_00038197 [Brassica cretica]|uniref:Uncharacterized protein n=2 Tax=Brassica TaxID=3705 RepID=A0A8S9SN89_BRACR|nr:hypothetical protein F2Q69_00038197 [Brassica cretica]VDD52404.1 unnamed protein product [Brassica oleracea]
MEQGTKKDKRGAILTDQPVEFYKRSGDRVGEYKRALETKFRDKLDLIKGLQDRINLISLELKDKKEEAQPIITLQAEKEAQLKKLNRAYSTMLALKLEEIRNQADAISCCAKITRMKEEEIQQMKEKLDHALNDVNERTKETLQASRDRVSVLDESRALCSKFESEVSVIRAEFDEAKERYEEKLAEERGNSEVLAMEKVLLKKGRDELERLSHELEESSLKNQNFQKELVEIYNTNKKLEEERKTVLTLEKEVKAMEKQMLTDREARKSLETDLEEAVRSVDEMNKNTSALSKELESVNTHVFSLENEKEMLQRTLKEAKKASKEDKRKHGRHTYLLDESEKREGSAVKETEEDGGGLVLCKRRDTA